VSGFKVPGPLSNAIFGEGYATPTLHVLGRNDILVVEERSRVLINISTGKRVEEHDGGTRQHYLSTLENFHSLRTRILSKAISYHPGPAGGHFLKHTCSTQQETFPALAFPHYRSQGQVQSRHFQADVLRAGTWRLSRGGVVPRCDNMDTIELEFMASSWLGDNDVAYAKMANSIVVCISTNKRSRLENC
jgi:hypothetical protein